AVIVRPSWWKLTERSRTSRSGGDIRAVCIFGAGATQRRRPRTARSGARGPYPPLTACGKHYRGGVTIRLSRLADPFRHPPGKPLGGDEGRHRDRCRHGSEPQGGLIPARLLREGVYGRGDRLCLTRNV